MPSISLNISGMTCNHCKMRVENALKELDGVSDAVVDLSAGRADVEYDDSKVSPGKMSEAVEDAGYTVEK